MQSLQGLTIAFHALFSSLESLLDDPDHDALTKFPILDTFQLTKRLAQLADETRSNPSLAKDLTARYIAEIPQATAYAIETQNHRFSQAVSHVQKVREAIQAEPPRWHDMDTEIEASVRELDRILTVLTALPIAEEHVALVRETEELRNRMAMQTLGEAARDATAQNRRRFALADLSGQIATLSRRFLDDVKPEPIPFMTFNGGPDNLWTQENRMHAEFMRSRLNALAAYADRITAQGLLVPFRHHAVPERDRELAADFSAFLFRAIRSPLTGPVQPRIATRAAEERTDPLTAWLLAQLEEARKEATREGALREYRPQTLEWIDSLRDYLRY